MQSSYTPKIKSVQQTPSCPQPAPTHEGVVLRGPVWCARGPQHDAEHGPVVRVEREHGPQAHAAGGGLAHRRADEHAQALGSGNGREGASGTSTNTSTEAARVRHRYQQDSHTFICSLLLTYVAGAK